MLEFTRFLPPPLTLILGTLTYFWYPYAHFWHPHTRFLHPTSDSGSIPFLYALKCGTSIQRVLSTPVTIDTFSYVHRTPNS